MVEELVIHIGDAKAGSTSIQAALAEKAARIEGRSLLYPARTDHNGLALRLGRPGARLEGDVHLLRIARQLRRSDADVAVISAEHFETVPPERLDRAIAQYLPDWHGRVRIVAYVRPHAERLVSAWAERTKQGLIDRPIAPLIDALRREGRFPYAPRFEAWRETFGERFTLRPMVRDRLERRDVVIDFLTLALGEGARIELPEGFARNRSPRLDELAVLRHLQRDMIPGGRSLRVARTALGYAVARELAAAARAGEDGPDARELRPHLHRALAERLADEFAADAERLDAAFFEGRPMGEALRRAVSGAPEAPQSDRIEDWYRPGQVRMIDALATILYRLASRDPEGFAEAVRQAPAETLLSSRALERVGRMPWLRRAAERLPGPMRRPLLKLMLG